jgi:hypothetical protein
MAHRHLVLAYVLTWVLQLGYVGFLGLKWRAGRIAPGNRDQGTGISE